MADDKADTDNVDIVYVSGSKPRKRFVGTKKSSNTTTGRQFYSISWLCICK